MAGPLSGITILDFTWALAGPFGTMLLADLGADVWKIETVTQTESRRGNGPWVHDVSTYFFSVNRGKKSFMLDLKAPEAKEIIYSLVPQVDVVTENFSPGTMDKLGFGYETLSKLNPALVFGSTSGFGQTGPYRLKSAVDTIVQGMGGVMSTTGHEGTPPSRVGYSIGDMGGGTFTALGILAALVERASSGRGQHVDVSMLDVQVALMENPIIRHLATGEIPGPVGHHHPLNTPHQALPASDGWLVLSGVKDWPFFCGVIGCDELIFDPRFRTKETRTENRLILDPILFAAFRKRTVAEWMDTLDGVCLVGPLNTVDKVVTDPQVLHREMIVELPTWTGGTLKVANTPIKHSRTPGGATRGAPRPGEHSADLLRRAGFSDERISDLVERGVVGTGPAQEKIAGYVEEL